MFNKKGSPTLNRFCALLRLLTATPALAPAPVNTYVARR
jgi:hypothetical protein